MKKYQNAEKPGKMIRNRTQAHSLRRTASMSIQRVKAKQARLTGEVSQWPRSTRVAKNWAAIPGQPNVGESLSQLVFLGVLRASGGRQVLFGDEGFAGVAEVDACQREVIAEDVSVLQEAAEEF